MVMTPALLAGVVTIGLAGICLALRRRRGGPALLPWLTGMLMLVVPAATSSYEARYVVPTVPFFCVAAALALREIGNHNRPVWRTKAARRHGSAPLSASTDSYGRYRSPGRTVQP
jgi:hypothetical protein